MRRLRTDCVGRGHFARLRIEHVFLGTAFAFARRAAFDQSGDARDHGSGTALRHRGAIRLSESPERRCFVSAMGDSPC